MHLNVISLKKLKLAISEKIEKLCKINEVKEEEKSDLLTIDIHIFNIKFTDFNIYAVSGSYRCKACMA